MLRAEGEAVEDHLAPPVLGWDGQPGDEDISGTSTCQTNFRGLRGTSHKRRQISYQYLELKWSTSTLVFTEVS